MIAADHRLRDAATQHSAAVLALVDALRAGRGAEWESPPGTAKRSTLDLHDDPTGEVATNAARLRVRANVEHGLLLLDKATAAFQTAADSLEDALQPYAALVHTPDAADS